MTRSSTPDFRERFGSFADDALITVDELAAVLSMNSRAAIYKALERYPACMPPAVRLSNGPRAPLRFLVADVRQWMRQRRRADLCAEVRPPEAMAQGMARQAKQGLGKPRLSADIPGFSLGRQGQK